jgi:hypothetical protein
MGRKTDDTVFPQNPSCGRHLKIGLAQVHSRRATYPGNVDAVIHNDTRSGRRQRQNRLNLLQKFPRATAFVSNLKKAHASVKKSLCQIDRIGKRSVRYRVETR